MDKSAWMRRNDTKKLRLLQQKNIRGQFRIGGEPYIMHPLAVAEIVRNQGYGMDYQITALFHDLLEDTDATEEEIFDLGGARVLEAVRFLTKQEGYVMAEYVAGIRTNPIAFVVKAADRLHNLRTAFCTDEAFRRAYVLETRQWYMDFSDEIKEAAEELAKNSPWFHKNRQRKCRTNEKKTCGNIFYNMI